MRRSEMVLSLALAASVGVSLWLWHELRDLRALQSEAATRTRSEPVTPAETHKVATSAAVSKVEAPVTPAASPVTKEPAKAQAAAKEPAPDDEWQVQRRMLQDPRYRAAYREQARLTFGLRRENIIRLAGLTPEQADAVIELQIDREIAQLEVPNSLHQEIFEASERAHHEALREVLEPEKYARLQEYMESRGSRMQVDRFRDLLGGAEMLRDDQVEPLIAAIHVERSQVMRELDESREAAQSSGDASAWREFEQRRMELEKEAHGRMHAAAAPILSPTQLEKFDAMLARELSRRAAEQRLQSLQAKIGSATPVTEDAD